MSELFSAALPGLQQAVQTAGDPAAEPVERLAAAGAFAESLGDLWPELEAGGPHLADFLAFLDNGVAALPERDDAMASVQILELMALFEAHLQDPDDAEVLEALLETASAETFDPPLPAESAALWHQGREPAEQAPMGTDSPGLMDERSESRSEVDASLAAADESATEPDVSEDEPDAQALGEEAAELLGILVGAIAESREEFLERVEEIAEAGDGDARVLAAQACREILDRFATASAQAGFLAFSTLCEGVGERILAQPSASEWSDSLIDGLIQLPWRMQVYLERPLDAATGRELVELLTDPHWLDPIRTDAAEALAHELGQDPLLLEPDAGSIYPEAVTREDLSLAPAEDIDPVVLASFRREGPDLAHRLASSIQSILSGGGGEPTLDAQRWAHTLKGSANICGVNAIAVLSHYLEDLLEFLTVQGLTPTPELGETLAAGADGLALMLDMLNGVEPEDPETLRLIVQEVLDWANRIGRGGASALTIEPEISAPPSTDRDAIEPEPEAESDPGSSAMPSEMSSDVSSERDDAYLQVPARTVDDLLRLVGELAVSLSRSEEQLAQARRVLGEAGLIEQRNQIQVAELEKMVDLQGSGIAPVAGASSERRSTFDPLELEEYNEMYTAARRINEGVTDTRELGLALNASLHELDESIQHQSRLQRLIRQLAMSTRLVDVDSVTPRLQRAVRQTCRATGKEAELQVSGGGTQMDGEVLDQLMPALMHLVRNSIDHGIESPDRREQMDKPRRGRIELRFGRLGDQISVSFGDDGAGLDLDRIRAKAIAAGMLDAAAEPTDQELVQLTLRPGFSTRDAVTQVSGRGVGMDVVASILRSLNGSLSIESEPGKGYRAHMRLPSSMLTLYCLLIRYGDQLLALPANDVRLVVIAGEGECVETSDGRQFRHDGRSYPLFRLDRLLGLRADATDLMGQAVLILNSDRGDQAVMVDALWEGRELVVMKPGIMVPRIPGLMAVSVLGDGTVVPIFEMAAILRFAESGGPGEQWQDESAGKGYLPTVLVVDDSVSMRRILAQLVTDGGYRALTARDGMDALRTMESERVDLCLVDMEMPQMNGLELAAHLRSRPETRTLPIGMITSRSTEKHRREAERVGIDRYFVKPYRDDEVMEFLQQALEQVF
ncbi:hybrid sensor histidine kinase/response regulator [Imhoffiella purpurea]|uniref:Chemotaxis protein CheA n=1 Tax=Imhoffiella purpurea TaxID=1249627 RepID=W9VCM3_9GAMM|nr:hybrid sensor histidine kinase/response regulator [Imhoffiella purpurea]EXJ14741.1 CheA like protein [Imhoffiella purpurea]